MALDWTNKIDNVDIVLADDINAIAAAVIENENKIKDKAEQVELERLNYYGDKDIVPSDESYFTVNETGETITGLTDTGKTQTELVIPYKINGVEITSIAGCYYSNALTIKIPNSVTNIGRMAFYNDADLKLINIPDNVTTIGNTAFSNCTSLTSINIPDNVTSIGVAAFRGCTNLTIYCEQGSYAETYAKENNIPVMYTDISAIDFNNKADKATTLEGYGIIDAYTKTEVDTKDSALKDDISDLKQKSIPHTTASGYPITVTDHLEGETVINYQVYGNSVQDGTPTPETPIEIQSVGNLVTDETSEYYGKYDVPVTVCGKNLFDMETILPEQGWVKQDDGSYYVANNGTVRNKVLWENTENYTGQLKILFQAKYAVDNQRGSYLWVNYTDGTYLVVYYAGTVVANTWYYPESSRTITDSNKIVQNIVWTYGTGATSTWVKDIIITKDLTATEYEQYSGETKHIYLDEPLRKVGDYADYVDFENQKVVRNVIYAKFDQTSSWSTLSGYENVIAKSISNSLIGEGYPCLSNISNFEPGKYSDSTYTGLTSWTSTRANIMWREDGITVDAFKERLATTPMFIICIRATPTEEPITVPELSAPTSEVMNVSSETATQPSNIYIKYYQDINKVITNLTNAILAQGGNV